MKKNIHPQYFGNATITCACGNSFVTGSTQEKINVEICSNCHPFYTGKSKLIDTTGRVDRFKKQREAAASTVKAVKKPRKTREAKASSN